jgi:enamine deaminase RidA (YjgF/YER057c/UK114 family)
MLVGQSHAQDGSIKIEKFNHSAWTKGIFSEAVTVTGIGNAKLVYLAGVGAEDENGPRGNVRHHGNFLEQCRYAYDKVKRVLAHHGAKLSDVVKVTSDSICSRTDTKNGPEPEQRAHWIVGG